MINTRKPEQGEHEKLLSSQEDHFNDSKSLRIPPATLQESFVAFANSDGGDLYIGIEDKKVTGERLIGFPTVEAANNLIHTVLEETVPAVENVDIEFIDFAAKGFVLHLSIPKSPKVHFTAAKKCFIRINSQKKEIKSDRILELSYSKGAFHYEKQAVENVELSELAESQALISYMKRVGSSLPKETFLRKQRTLTKKDDRWYPNVGGVLLFENDPQASLDARCAMKIYRLRTTESQYKREQLEEMPQTINGSIEKQIHDAIKEVEIILSGVPYYVGGKLVKLKYPAEAIKEILVNAVIHRDYSLSDDIHIRIYDNRIEIQSPGRLPGYITVNNIYDERFSRNPNIVRMLHNLPNPVNHDIGEGLDTARNELRKAGLVAPEIKQLQNAVLVTIKHQRIASLEDIILEFLGDTQNKLITNKEVRELSGEDDVNKIKKAFQKLRKQGIIEPENEEAHAFKFRYRLSKGKSRKKEGKGTSIRKVTKNKSSIRKKKSKKAQKK
jgi:ATP-dependent DNA helicase RecG